MGSPSRSLNKLSQWFGIPRRTIYYKPTKTVPKVYPALAEPVRAMIEKSPSFGYRTVAAVSISIQFSSEGCGYYWMPGDRKATTAGSAL